MYWYFSTWNKLWNQRKQSYVTGQSRWALNQSRFFSGQLWITDQNSEQSNIMAVLTALWLLYVPQGLTFDNSTFCPHRLFMCSVWIWEQTAIISMYSIKWLVFITETECVYCAVRCSDIFSTCPRQILQVSRRALIKYLCLLLNMVSSNIICYT